MTEAFCVMSDGRATQYEREVVSTHDGEQLYAWEPRCLTCIQSLLNGGSWVRLRRIKDNKEEDRCEAAYRKYFGISDAVPRDRFAWDWLDWCAAWKAGKHDSIG